MKLYRAIPTTSYPITIKNVPGVSTRRIPSNVPYLVDNVWEYLRPHHAPSRRNCAYASLSPELALKNASSHTENGFTVWEVMMPSTQNIVIYSVSDAREHPDIKNVPYELMKNLKPFIESKSVFAYEFLAPIFLPVVPHDDLLAFF